MPIFLDRHDLKGATAADIAEAHRKDLEVQEAYGVRFLTYWFDEARGTGFCLIDAPDIQTAMRVHDEAHGHVAKDVIEVDLSAVEAFLGRVSRSCTDGCLITLDLRPGPARDHVHGHRRFHRHDREAGRRQGGGDGARSRCAGQTCIK